jgi:hypothetical protein
LGFFVLTTATRVILECLLVMSWAFLGGLLEVEIVLKEMHALVEGQ